MCCAEKLEMDNLKTIQKVLLKPANLEVLGDETSGLPGAEKSGISLRPSSYRAAAGSMNNKMSRQAQIVAAEMYGKEGQLPSFPSQETRLNGERQSHKHSSSLIFSEVKNHRGTDPNQDLQLINNHYYQGHYR
jgi:hypothetical protein